MKMRNSLLRDLCLAGAGSCLTMAGALSTSAALAQTATPAASTAEAVQTFAVPAGPLSAALNSFAVQSGLALVYPASLTAGLRTKGYSGRTTVREVMARLLSGTGLSYRFLNAKTITVEPPPIAGARTLGAVQVEGVQTDAFAPVNGFGAGAGSNGSSDPTATEGTGSLTTNGASVASKTPQSLKDTPQSVTVITAARIQEQNLTDLTSALNYAPGVTLYSSNGLQTMFFSRGFQITSFQIDGGGPLDLGSNSDFLTPPNLAEFDNVQVLRGSDALFGGAGQPGGVVNLGRKRPLDHEQFIGDLDVGSWANYRGQADVTGPIGFDGHLRARLVISDQDRDFFYDLAHQNKAFAYGVLEADLGPDTLLRAGFSYERQHNTGWDFNGLPRYSSGGDLGLSRSTNIAAPWALWNFSTPEFFAALEHRFNADWNLKIDYTRLAQTSSQEVGATSGVIYAGVPASDNYGETSQVFTKYNSVQSTASATLNGDFQFLGLKQTLSIGADYSDGTNGLFAREAYAYVPIDVLAFNPNSLNPRPGTPPFSITTPILDQEQWGAYATLNVQPIQNLHIVGGIRVSSYWDKILESYYFGFPSPLFSLHLKNDSSGILTPYAAVSYGVTPDVSIYASYADIFQAQGEYLDTNGKPLPPVTGETYETGVKGSFNGGKLNSSLSAYYTDKSNQGVPYSGACAVGFSCYINSGAVTSEGIDLEVSGQILPGWQAQVGYTYNESHCNKAAGTDPNNTDYQCSVAISSGNAQQPRHQVKIWSSYTPTGSLDHLTIGGGLRLESARSSAGYVCSVANDISGYCATGVEVPYAFTQGLYAVVDLRAAYRFNRHWQAALDLTNIGDTRYYATAGQTTGNNFYGEPRAFMFSLRASY